jgi:hypothetical protein
MNLQRTLMKTALLAGFCLLAATTMAQNNFMLMAVSGDVQYAEGSTWKKARTGQKLNDEDKLKVGTGGYAAVILNNSKTYELKQSGTYTLSRLVPAGTTAEKNSVTGKYVDYVVNRSNSNKAGSNMSNLGAVERSMAPLPLTPRTSKVIESEVKFAWRSQSGAPSYYFQIADQDGNVIYSTEVKDTFIVVDVTPMNLTTNQCYWWQLASTKMKGMMSDELCFQMASTTDRAAIQKAAEEIRTNSEDPNSAICNIFLAQYYQEQQVNDKAMEAYEAAIAAQPNVDGYRKIYAEFLSSIGLASYAKEILGDIQLDSK